MNIQTEAINFFGGTAKRKSLTPNLDQINLDPKGRMSVEYAKARHAIDADFRLNFASNQPLAKNLRRQAKRLVVETLQGKVSTEMEENKKTPGEKIKVLYVTFPDGSKAKL